MTKRNILIGVPSVTVLCATGWWLINQITLNFTLLAVILVLMALLVPITYYRSERGGYSAKRRAHMACFSGILLLIFMCLALKTLDNYFFADQMLYKNSDHHTVRIDGVKVNKPTGFVLAENSNRAFFDDDGITGKATLISVDDSIVNLRLKGFSRSLYLEHYNERNRLYHLSLLQTQKEKFVTFTDQDTLTFQTRGGSKFRFYIEDRFEGDSVYYHLVDPSGKDYVSDEKRFLIRGLSLNSLLSGVAVEGVDFEGIHVIRPEIFTLVKKSDRIERYKDVGYALEFQAPAFLSDREKIERVSSSANQKTLRISSYTTSQDEVAIPLNRSFSIGYDDSKTKSVRFVSNDKGLELRYTMPQYHYFARLSNRDDNTVYISTNIEGNNSYNLPENIMLFDLFSKWNNVNQLCPFFLSYVSGPTTEELQFNFYSRSNRQGNPESHEAVIKAGEAVPHTKAIYSSVDWLVQIENFRATTPFSILTMKWVLLAFALALTLILCLGAFNLNSKESSKRNTFTPFEFVLYLVLVYLLAFRLFLLWRTSVFVPVENVSLYEFSDIFRNYDNFSNLRVMLGLFVILLFLGKILILRDSHKRRGNRTMQKSIKTSRAISLIVLSCLVSIVAAITDRFTWIGIIVPISGYFFNDFLIHYKWAKNYNEHNNRVESVTLKLLSRSEVLPSWINALFFVILLFVKDSGYGILFLAFVLFWSILKFHDFCKANLSVFQEKTGRWRSLIVAILLVLFGCVFIGFTDIMWFSYSNDFAWVTWSVIGMVLALTLVFITNAKLSNRWTIVFIVAVAVLFAGAGFGVKPYLTSKGKHTTQRIVVHFKNPEAALTSIEDDATDNRFRQSSLNHWILGEYNKIGNETDVMGDWGKGFFKMQPHSKQGAMWNAQMTDIALARFVIAEHSRFLPFLLVLFFLLLLIWSVRIPVYHRFAKSILMQISLLLFLQCLLIWMANTRHFIFFGQDFPMISINSRLTIIYIFVLSLVWILVAVYEQCHILLQVNEREYLNLNRWAKQDSNQLKLIMGVMLLAISCTILGKLKDKENYNLSVLMKEKVIPDINKVNNVFVEFQRDSIKGKIELRRDMSALMERFNKSCNVESRFSNAFSKRLWTNFVHSGSKRNNSKSVIHAHKTKEGLLEVSVLHNFYNRKLPQTNEDAWKGSVIEASVKTTNQKQAAKVKGLGYAAYRIPGEWTSDGNPITLLNSKEGIIEGIHSRPLVMNQKQCTGSALVFETDKVSLGKNDLSDLDTLRVKKSFFARNVMVNGQRTFVYPLGSKFYWIKNFAEEVANQKYAQLQKAQDYNADLEITLDEELTSDLYDHLSEATASATSVVVADGSGAIRAMVDVKRNYALNPNNRVRIARITDSLYMEGFSGTKVEQAYFGNTNLMHMTAGPGSSQKPLVWTAIASKINYPWKSLKMEPIYETIGKNVISKLDKHENGSRFLLSSFNRITARGSKNYFGALLGDENRGNGVDLTGYMRHSSNYYNAVMVYMGLFQEADYNDDFLQVNDELDGNSLFTRFAPKGKASSKFKDLYPIMENKGKRFSFNKQPDAQDVSSCLLLSQLEHLYGMENRDFASLAPGVTEYKMDDSNRYAYLAPSYLTPFDGNLFNYIKFISIGSAQWNVTPIKMAEMYGRMASLNSKYCLSLINNHQDYERFEEVSKGYADARPNLLAGMNKVISNAGTASGVAASLGIARGSDVVKMGDYYLYSKTGTTNKGKMEFHRLGIVITNTDLTQIDEDDLEDLKFYVVYFTYSGVAGRSQTYAKVIKEIISSNLFKNYMNSKL